MTLRWQWKNKVYEINIGYKTFWYHQSFLISINQLWFCHMEVSYAEMIWHSKRKETK